MEHRPFPPPGPLPTSGEGETRCVGVDVGGPQKGYHVAFLAGNRLVEWFQERDPQVLAARIRAFEPAVVAIDAPPKALRQREETRAAEREMFRLGYRIQWTRRAPLAPDSWMLQGERLWALLEGIPCVETFPTAASDRLETCELALPLALLSGRPQRATYKDFVDAALCAWVASRVASGTGLAIGKEDEFGPIWI